MGKKEFAHKFAGPAATFSASSGGSDMGITLRAMCVGRREIRGHYRPFRASYGISRGDNSEVCSI